MTSLCAGITQYAATIQPTLSTEQAELDASLPKVIILDLYIVHIKHCHILNSSQVVRCSCD